MRDPLLMKALADLRGQVIWWGVGIGALLALTVALYPSISAAYGDIVEQLPPGFAAFFGVEGSLDEPEGYLNAEFFSYAPVVLAIFAILAGTTAVAGEESQGTLDLVLAQPVGRLRAISAKLVGLVLGMAAVLVIAAVWLWVTVAFVDIDLSFTRVTTAFALLLPFEVSVAFAAVLLTQFFSGRVLAGSVMAVILVASYILEALSHLTSTLEPFRPLFVTAYYQGRQALVSEVSWGYVVASAVTVLMLAGLSVALFVRRDIGTGSWARMPRVGPWRRRPSLRPTP